MIPRRALRAGALVLVLTAACTSEPRDDADAARQPPAATSPAATSSPETAPTVERVTEDLRQFRTPSGNIGCAITPEAATCELLEAAWAPARPETPCEDADWNGRAVTVDAQQTHVGICTTDTVMDSTAQVLGYDTALASGDVRCTSRREGLTCEHVVSGHGFTVSQARLTVF